MSELVRSLPAGLRIKGDVGKWRKLGKCSVTCSSAEPRLLGVGAIMGLPMDSNGFSSRYRSWRPFQDVLKVQMLMADSLGRG